MHISKIILAYFVIGAVMFGGGAVDFENAGVANFFIDRDDVTGEVTPANGSASPADRLTGVGGALVEIGELLGGGIIFVWNLIVGLIAYLNWPIIIFLSHNAPIEVTVLLGGTPTVMFYMGLIRLVRTSA